MATEVGPVKSVEVPPLRPLKIPNRLAATPNKAPSTQARFEIALGKK